jgi:hypothetical protein
MPSAIMAWAGCSSSKSDGTSGGFVDPGGTFGAEVSVVVTGRGRVLSATPGIDCPGSCFTKYIFTSGAADGAAGGLVLKAIPTPGLSFKGWHFDTSPSGSAGRGPDNCNPVQRPGSTPPGAGNGVDLTLPFGEATGSAPAGQEGACAGFTQVPLAYKITAEFDSDLPPGDSGVDAGPSETVYLPANGSSTAYDLGMVGSALYWRYNNGVGDGVAYGSFPTEGVSQSPSIVSSASSGQTITLFQVDANGVIYQTSSGLFAVRSNSSFPTQVGTSIPPTCNALSMDSSYNVYCRTSSSIVTWSYPSYTTMTTLYSGVPFGSTLVVESSFGQMYYGSSSAIEAISVSGDGGLASPTLVVSAIAPTHLRPSSSHLWWLDASGYVYATASKSTLTSSTDTGIPSSLSYRYFSPDPSNSSAFWVASDTAIHHAVYAGTSKPFRTGMSSINGMAADYQYVYFTQTDGTIKRASRSGF